jgi:hypothetical protein
MEWQNDYDGPHRVAGMSLGTDLLNLRRNKTSTVATLLSGMERLATARSETTLMTRAFALNELADAVLAQVAVHALDACWDDLPPPKMRRDSTSSRRRLRQTDAGQLHQRRLFA